MKIFIIMVAMILSLHSEVSFVSETVKEKNITLQTIEKESVERDKQEQKYSQSSTSSSTQPSQSYSSSKAVAYARIRFR